MLNARKIRANPPVKIAPDKSTIANRLYERQMQQKRHHNQKANVPLAPLIRGQSVRIQHPITAKWNPVTVENVRPEPRLYDVREANGGSSAETEYSYASLTRSAMPMPIQCYTLATCRVLPLLSQWSISMTRVLPLLSQWDISMRLATLSSMSASTLPGRATIPARGGSASLRRSITSDMY